MVKINKIYNKDYLDVMSKIDDGFIDLTITSPPYDNLREYGGHSKFNFKALAKELFRVTKKGGIVVWIVGDATINGSETGTSFKQALYFKKIGFNLHDTMIFRKASPPLTHRRYEQAFEYMFVFSRGKPKTFNGIIRPSKTAGLTRSSKKMRQDSDELGDRSTKGFTKNYSLVDNIFAYEIGNLSTKDKIAHKHPAIFPDKLANDHIISWSNKGDLILEPMCGSGTTCKMDKTNKRNFIGIEINKEYYKIAKKRILNCGWVGV